MSLKTFFKILLILSFFTLSGNLFAQPQIEWHRTYNSPSNTDDFASSMAIDSSGNIITFGWIFASGSNGGYVINKYTPSGQLLWTARYFENTGLPLRSKKVCVDAQNNVYVTGSKGSIVTVKFNSLGILQWVRRYSGFGASISEPNDMKIDRYGFIYITGESSEPSPSISDYVTIKYNSNGDSLWTRKYNGIGNGIDRAQALEVDSIGNVYITGDSESLHDTIYYPDITTIKYDSFGNTVWVNRYVNQNVLNGYSYDLKLDKSRNLYSCGFLIAPNFIGYLMKYDQLGNTIWIKTTDSITQVNGKFRINVDLKSNIYFTGTNNYPPGNYHVIKYDTSGTILFQKSVSPNPPFEAVLESTVIDAYGNIYITGGKYTAKIDTAGNLVWSILNIVNDSSYTSVSILLDANYSFYMCGNFGYNFITVKYNQPIGITPVSNNLPLKFKLYNNYPNPFNPVTYIQFDIPLKSKVIIVVFDILGKQIEILIDSELNSGSYKINFDGSNYSSGIYFYRMITDDFTEAKKMILIK